MLVKLIGKAILKTIPNEDELSDLSQVEFKNIIRSLRAVIDSDSGFIEVEEKENGDVYSEKYKIGFYENEYIKK